MARSMSRSGAFSPPLSSAASYTANSQSKINVVTRLAIEGKAKQNADGASIMLHLRVNSAYRSYINYQHLTLLSSLYLLTL